VNLPNCFFLFVVIFSFSACHRRSVDRMEQVQERTTSPEPSSEIEEMGGVEGPTGTIVIGKVVKTWLDADRFEGDGHPCDTHPCEAEIELMAVTQIGSDFHGQFEAGDVIKVHFDFTLDPTKDLFPELNTHFDGLTTGEFFKATLNTPYASDHPDQYRVGEYEKLK